MLNNKYWRNTNGILCLWGYIFFGGFQCSFRTAASIAWPLIGIEKKMILY
jgi:hypothetical protein